MSVRLMVLLVALAGCGDDDGASAVDAGDTDAAAPAVRPDKRSDLSGASDSATDTIVVFGGDNGPIVNQMPSPSFLAETWLFSPTDGWNEVTGASPSARGR